MVLQRAQRMLSIFASLASKQAFFCQEARLDREVSAPLIAMAVVWCTRKALDVKPSWQSECFAKLVGLEASEVFSCFVSLYKAYDPHVDEAKLRLEMGEQRPEKQKRQILLEVPCLDLVNGSGSQICAISTACGSGDNSQDLSLPYQENHSSLVVIERTSLASESSLIVVETEAPVKRESILRMFRKATKVAVEPPNHNFGLQKSGSTILSKPD